MKISLLPLVSVLLASTGLAQFGIPISVPILPPLQQIPADDPVLFSVSKTKSYAKTYGFTNANLQVAINGYGTVFAVQDDTQVLVRATTGAKVEGLASVFGYTLSGARATCDADAQNATWTYTNGTASVTSQTDNAKAKAFIKVGPYTLVNETKSFTGDIPNTASFVKNYTRHIFDVTQSFPVAGLFDVDVTVGADAGAVMTFTGTLDPVVTAGSVVGAKAKLVGAANAWLSANASVTFGALCAYVGVQVDMRLANSGFNGAVTAERNAVTGSVGLTEQPLALVLKLIWSYCLDSGTKTIWSWASPIYEVNYNL